MLDLDVGFIDSPLNIVRKLHDSKKDIFVQVMSFLTLSFLLIFITNECSSMGQVSLEWLLLPFNQPHNITLGAFSLQQKDLTFVMNRTVVGWRTWYTEPMPNIGENKILPFLFFDYLSRCILNCNH